MPAPVGTIRMLRSTFTSDKIDKAMAIMADVVLNPSFKQEEIDLVKIAGARRAYL